MPLPPLSGKMQNKHPVKPSRSTQSHASSSSSSRATPAPRLTQEVSYNVPAEMYPGGYDGFEHYMILKEEVCYDHRSPPDFRQLYSEGRRMIRDYPAERLERGVQLKDAPMLFEYSLRVLSLCEIPITTRSSYTVAGYLGDVAGLSTQSTLERNGGGPPRVKNNSPRLQLRALAGYAYFHLWAFWCITHGGSLHALKKSNVIHNAVYAANLCVERGFIPPIVLRIASWMATTEARYGVDMRKSEGFKRFGSLWKAHEEYLARLQERETARLAKVAKAPNQYRCANEGCDIQAINRNALKRCAGHCPEETKPYYCSLYCQRLHWIIHREACKKDLSAVFDGMVEDDGDPDWVDVDDFHVPPDRYHVSDKGWPLFAEREGPEIFIDIPNVSVYRKGEIIRVRTRTLSPDCLKAYKMLWVVAYTNTARVVVDGTLIDPPPNMGYPAH
ncbi:hypothetical protein C8Q73DRAFT_697629 [Cubamyces lactineus]|nr:hypothetical protein C8Q73DRAFT_697629 [Cubamyces lactineus]